MQAGNIIPAMVTAKFNIRFNTNHRSDDLIGWLEEHFERVGGPWHATWRTSAQPFVTPFGTLTDLVLAAVETVTGQNRLYQPVVAHLMRALSQRFVQ